ncbi:ectomycorrhiza-regulated esterase [Laetiporus sulphureus 93-53]|uniref:Ectomycorrhiza-regulated esterase n=1 Tax=Laetiporus sulphureus 93-53 TaxID=1314785 RepID=A0A165HPL6_9APHY|nr:ectomycorrhiza-regulated esterase [Laetiporus sulphureus 93-53]KZT12015.1 ectomycorrhiza-regulated esterase [Laetiporus sulphureus 93-53]
MANIPITSKKSTKLYIPHPHEETGSIAGVLEQLSPGESTHGRRIALIMHGTMGHKDYLFQKRLALRFPVDSFRFDFRANFESPGTFSFGKIELEVIDLHVVADYLMKQYGYVIDLLVGHSKGSVVAMLWLCTYPKSETGSVRGYVNVSGRYRVEKMYDQMRKPENQQQLAAQGFYELKATVARKPVVHRITEQDHHEFAGIDTTIVWNRFPKEIHVLTMHGLRDTVVPPYDAIIYAEAYSSRTEGTHNLYIVDEADHNFTGMADHVAATILQWVSLLDRNELKTGIWPSGLKPKL